MNDMTPVIVPKSDQVSADDFLSGPRSFIIESVEIRPGTEQPVSILLVGESRAWKPCKSMARVLVAAWGPDANVYIGRSVTLYRDPKVKWGGMEVGGIRISHMSDIEREMIMALTATKGKRTPYTVKPLASQPKQEPQQTGRQKAEDWVNGYIAAIKGCETAGDLAELQAKAEKTLEKLKAHEDLTELVGNATKQKLDSFAEADPFSEAAE